MYAMVDCNSFYASCERLFRPDLASTPVAVLSNNDGCVIARSEECKQIGLPMGVPTFKAKSLIQRYGVQVFSSNYALYADISSRVMATLEDFSMGFEVYSIDEAFLVIPDDLNKTSTSGFYHTGQKIKNQVKKHCGMPVCVGIAPTKTLSKLANHAAKKYKKFNGVVDLSELETQRKLMAVMPVEKVWGIGRNLALSLTMQNIKTALDLCDAPVQQMRERYSVLMGKTIQELRGIACIDLEETAPPKKEIVCSRSFGKRVTDKVEMAIAISSHVERAGKKLRREKRLTDSISVFIRTNRYDNSGRQCRRSATTPLVMPTNDTTTLNKAAQGILQKIWQEGYSYQRVGVMLHSLVAESHVQYDLFQTKQTERSQRLMQVMDVVNQRYQYGLGYASTLTSKQHSGWLMRRQYLSPAYTTRWSDLLRVS